LGRLLSSSPVYHLLAYPHHPSSASKRRKKMHRTLKGMGRNSLTPEESASLMRTTKHLS